MYKNLKKKIVTYTNIVIEFVRKYLVQIIIISGTFIILLLIRSFPYINIIPNYQFLVIGITLFLIVAFFNAFITNKNIVWGVLIFFAVAAIATIVGMTVIANVIGFVIFVLLAITTLREIIKERKEFKKETSE